MQDKHILNIGYPRSGTTWLWENLCEQSWFDGREIIKENQQLIKNSCDIEDYCNTYNKFKISGNFYPNMILFDRYLISSLSKVPNIHVSVILRDPISWMISQLQFTNNHFSNFDERVSCVLDQKNFLNPAVLIKRWKNYFSDISIFFYDDLKQNSEKFFKDYCLRMGLPTVEKCNKKIRNPSKPAAIYNNINLSVETNQRLAQNISELEILTNKSLNHWKTL